MTKTKAYTSPDKYETKSAQQIKEIREKVYNRQQYPHPLYSMHSAGRRKLVHHVNKGRTGHFSYNPNGGPGNDAGGESLNHWLFKEILYGLKNTQLSLFQTNKRTGKVEHWCNEPITITYAERERPIPRKDGGRPLYADIYFEFESKNSLGLKWEGKVYVEICNTHPIEADKQDVLRELDLPMIEVDIRESPYAYLVEEDDTTDEQEEAHMQGVRNMLQHENGFLKALVLHNPSSKPYLSKLVQQKFQENKELKKKLEASEYRVRDNEDGKIKANQQLVVVRADLQTVTEERDGLKQQITVLRKELKSQASENQQLSKDVKSYRFSYRMFVGYFIVAMGMVVYVLYNQYFPSSPRPEPVAQAAAPVTPITPIQPIDMKPTTTTAHAKHHSSTE